MQNHPYPHVAPNKIRIVHLITGLEFGGAEQQLKQLILGSDPSQFEHIVISMMGVGPIGMDLRRSGVKVYSLNMPRGVPALTGLIRLRSILRQVDPDVLHCWLYHSCLLGLLAARLAKVAKLVWCLRSANDGLRNYRFQTRSVVKLCALLSRFSSAITLNSEAGRLVHAHWGYHKSRMQVIPNGVNLQLFRPDSVARADIRQELRLPLDTVLIGLIARYHPVKDHSTFFRAAQIVSARQPRVHFVLAGSGVTVKNSEVSHLVSEHRLQDTVHLLDVRSDIPRLTAALDIACLSSWSESFPNVICEAMACCVPCAVTDVGDARLIVGETGKVVPPRNPTALAQALLSLIEMPVMQRMGLGQSAHERAKMFSLNRAVSAYETLYSSLCGLGDQSMIAAARKPARVN